MPSKQISRIGLRFPLYPAFAAPALYYLIHGLRRRNRNDFILSGLFLGFGLHGYSPYRLVPFVVLVVVAIYLIHKQSKGSRGQTLMMFAVLVRRIRRDLEGQSFVVERDARGKSIPVFEAPRAVQLLGDPSTREYLIEMLCSFVRTNTGVVYWKEYGAWHKRKFSDMDMDDMIALCHLVEPGFKPRLYKRIADIALFLTGIYPDHASSPARRPRSQALHRRTVPDYEREGRRFYALAAREPQPPWSATVFEALAEQFTLAREALTTLSDRYLKPLRARYFDQPAG